MKRNRQRTLLAWIDGVYLHDAMTMSDLVHNFCSIISRQHDLELYTTALQVVEVEAWNSFEKSHTHFQTRTLFVYRLLTMITPTDDITKRVSPKCFVTCPQFLYIALFIYNSTICQSHSPYHSDILFSLADCLGTRNEACIQHEVASVITRLSLQSAETTQRNRANNLELYHHLGSIHTFQRKRNEKIVTTWKGYVLSSDVLDCRLCFE